LEPAPASRLRGAKPSSPVQPRGALTAETVEKVRLTRSCDFRI